MNFDRKHLRQSEETGFVVFFDTTSVNVWGDYDCCNSDSGSINITHGYSKDHRPDLKQFLVKMLGVGRNVPLLGSCEDGNESDKSINNTGYYARGRPPKDGNRIP